MKHHNETLRLHTPYNAALKAIDGTPVDITEEDRKRLTITDPLEAIRFAIDFLPATNTYYFLADFLEGNHEPYWDDYLAWAELKKAKAAQEQSE